MSLKNLFKRLFRNTGHKCKYLSDGGSCVYCGKTVLDSLREQDKEK